MKKIITIFLLFFLLESCKKKVESIFPEYMDITESVYASGQIKSKKEYQVFSTANGLIAELLVNEGDKVKKGDALFRITNIAAKLNTENAKIVSDFSAENANQDKLTELKNTIELAKSKLDVDASLLQRQQILWNQNIGSQIELEQRQLAYKNSLSSYETARLKLSQLQKQISFQAKQSRKNLQIAEKLYSDYIIRSEIDGTIYNLTKVKGEMVGMQNPIATIGDNTDFLIELQVDEYDITKLLIGQKIYLNMDSYKGKVFEAEVEKIYPIMNERSKSFKVEAKFIIKPDRIYPNLTCEANIVIQQKKKALTIPRNYLLDGDFVLGENNQKIKVTTGLKDYQKVEILNGITNKDALYKPLL